MGEQATRGSVGAKRFLDFAATKARVDRSEFTRRILAMLSPGEETFEAQGGRSRLNRDGNPLRLTLVGRDESASQITFDPHWYIGCARERTQRVSESLEQLARDMDCAHLLEAHQQLVSRVMLTPGCAYEALGQGTILLRCSPRGEQLGFTFDLTDLDAISGWSLLQEWLSDTTEQDWKLKAVLAELRAAGFTITRLGHQARAGEAFATVSAERDGRHNAPWPHIEGTRAETRERLDIALGALKSEQTHTEHICVEFSPESGHITRVRTEFEPARAEARWLSALHDAFIYPGEDAHEGLLEYHAHELAEITRLGIEEDLRGAQVRPLLDLKPRSAPSIEGRHRDGWAEILEERILMAIDALYARQHADGAWRDYALPFGSADCFTTAFVGLTLARSLSYSASAGRRAKRAASWLAGARTQQEGWGMGSYTGAETRSTALVLRLFGEVERDIRPEDQAWLEGMWDRSGGFIGCNGPRHWSDVHPCVTALAWPALDSSAQQEREEGLHEYLARFARADGRWRAYWWRTHHFSTYHHLYMLEELGWSDEFPIEREVTHLSAEATPFEVAWALGIAAMDEQGDGRVEELLTALLASQQVDGSWLGSADLRVTDPGCEAPWEQPRGELFTDTFGAMTTASALWVLLDLASQL